ncbi:hypothetical protein PIB30_028082 [Stylosanthes scabra]|uniref:Uncharacterized protein n=1 Tax=Stylosanthes scabra TaxID=79078 RepID=A0ABU6SB27_9FABA|nr:hypothetical protein [Stylosanthes scabra]
MKSEPFIRFGKCGHGTYAYRAPPATLFASASKTASAASATSAITSSPSPKVVNPLKKIVKYFNQE